MTVVFIDTSVLCNFLRIPSKAQQQLDVHKDYAFDHQGRDRERPPPSEELSVAAHGLTDILRLVAQRLSLGCLSRQSGMAIYSRSSVMAVKVSRHRPLSMSPQKVLWEVETLRSSSSVTVTQSA